ncbi:hypothetical protein E4U45_007326 [Claviceps purpurea]|nr:hypothetical protein E4U45_007326 [Claviceps purpurea]
MALNFTIRDAAATRGYASDTDFEVYSKALLQLATEREQMPQFLSMKGSKTSLYTPYRRPQYRDSRNTRFNRKLVHAIEAPSIEVGRHTDDDYDLSSIEGDDATVHGKLELKHCLLLHL